MKSITYITSTKSNASVHIPWTYLTTYIVVYVITVKEATKF